MRFMSAASTSQHGVLATTEKQDELLIQGVSRTFFMVLTLHRIDRSVSILPGILLHASTATNLSRSISLATKCPIPFSAKGLQMTVMISEPKHSKIKEGTPKPLSKHLSV